MIGVALSCSTPSEGMINPTLDDLPQAQVTAAADPPPTIPARAGAREPLLKAVGEGKLEDLVQAILRVTERTKEVIEIQSDSSIPAAAATEVGGVKKILLNPKLPDLLRGEAGSEWGTVFIFAHEMMHHLQGHYARMSSRELSYPAAEDEANEAAGRTLARLGATLEETTIAVKAACRLIKANTAQVEQYLSAVERGWRSAKDAG